MRGFSSKKSDKQSTVANNLSMSGASMEGILKRKNRHGEWKERYCKFNATQFLGYKTSKGKATTELKECYELKEIVTAELNAKGQLLVTLLNGEQSLFKGQYVDAWMQAFLDLSQEANELHQESIAQAAGTGKTISISGYLQKQSHNKYQGYQERFVRLEGTQLKYYKKEGESQEQGAINIFSAEFIRPFSDDENCKIFEIADQDDRVYAFQARNHIEMNRWIQTLNTVRTAALDKAEEEKAAKLEAETPERIRFYDNEGEEAFKQLYREQLMDMYPDPEKLLMSIKMHIQYATEIVDYLKDLIPELQAVGNRPARYDILAVAMTETNFVLSERFRYFLEPTFDDGTNDEGNNYLHDILEGANLGELHMLINWISKYQCTLRSIRCPVHTPDTPAVTSQARLSLTHLQPKHCELFNFIQRICKLYVHGGSSGAKGGAAEHLAEHCQKVWNAVENNPEEMLQRHNNGTFFTEAPIQMWLAINQHISLATSTNSPILHVMIAEKVVTSLIGVFEHVIQYVQTLDTSQRPELREIELEYMSALANDTALHIEDVIELIENFTIPEIREKIDEIFDPLTTTLFQCGQACLKRLAGLVMSDVQGLLDQVFEEEWMEGNQMRVATATISDYMRDFQEFLVPFWADKFVMTILEEVIVSYTRTLLFRKDKKKSVTTTVTTTDNSSSSPSVGGMFSSFFQKTKQTITQTITTQVPTHVPVDEESLGRLAQDVNILNAFFSLKAGQELATEFLQLINEVSLLLFIDVPGIIQHIAVRVSEYPSAAQAIHDVAIAVMKLRYEDFTKADMDYVSQQVQQVLQTAPADALHRDAEGIVEGRLGLLYTDVVPKDPNTQLLGGKQKLTLAQRMRVMANIPLFGAAARTIIGEEEEEDGEKEGGEKESGTMTGGDKLLKDVMNVLNEQEPDSLELDNEFAREQAQREADEAARKAKLLYYDGYLEKKSPAHNLWQRRFYKLMTREIDDKFSYSLLWYKKEGGSLIKALEVDKIATLAVLLSARNMAYVMPPKSQLMLMSEATSSGLARCAIPVVELEHEENHKGGDGNKNSVVKQEYFTFLITQSDGKEHILRGLKVDRVMKWINMLAQAGGLAYDSTSRTWTRAAFTHLKNLEKEGRLPTPEAPPLTATTTPAARRRTLSSTSTLDDVAAAITANPIVVTNPKQIRGSIVGNSNAQQTSGGNKKMAMKELMQSLQDDNTGDIGRSGSISHSTTLDENDTPVERRMRSSTAVSSSTVSRGHSSSMQQDDQDEAAVVAAKLSTEFTEAPQLSASRLAQLQSFVNTSQDANSSLSEPMYMTAEEENNFTSSASGNNTNSANATKRRGSSVAQMLSAMSSAFTSSSPSDTNNNINDDRSSSGSATVPPPASPQQRRSFTVFGASSLPPPPPPAASSPMSASCTGRKTSTIAAILNDSSSDREDTTEKKPVSPPTKETSNPLLEMQNDKNLSTSPNQTSVKRGSVSTENPLAITRPSLSATPSSRSIRKNVPPPPPPPSAESPQVTNSNSEERDSMFFDRDTQAWPSSADLPSGTSPPTGTQTQRKSSIAKRVAQNRAARQSRVGNDVSSRDRQQDQDIGEKEATNSSAANFSIPPPPPPAPVQQSNSPQKASSNIDDTSNNHETNKLSNSSKVPMTSHFSKPVAMSQTNAMKDDDPDRFSVMTVDLDGPSHSHKPLVATGGTAKNANQNNSNKKPIQTFEVQDDHHNDNERLLKDKKQAGCPCVIS